MKTWNRGIWHGGYGKGEAIVAKPFSPQAPCRGPRKVLAAGTVLSVTESLIRTGLKPPHRPDQNVADTAWRQHEPPYTSGAVNPVA